MTKIIIKIFDCFLKKTSRVCRSACLSYKLFESPYNDSIDVSIIIWESDFLRNKNLTKVPMSSNIFYLIYLSPFCVLVGGAHV